MFVFLFVLLGCFVFSKTVIQDVITSGSLDISYPLFSSYYFGEDVEFNFHVHNSSGFEVTNVSLDCLFHLFNSSGHHIYENNNVFYGDSDWVVELNASMFDIGSYVYYFECNNSEAGTISTSFDIVREGYDGSLQEALIYCVLIFIVLCVIVLCVVGGLNIDGNNVFTVGGDLVEINYGKYVKVVLFFCGYFFSWILNYFLLEVSSRFLSLDVFYNILNIVFIILTVLLIPCFIIFVVFLVVKVSGDVELHNLAKRGLKPRK